MGLNIKNPEVEKLAAEVAALAGESKTETIRQALLTRKKRLTAQQTNRMEGVREWLARDVWPQVSPEFRDKPMTKADWDALNDV